MKCEALIDPETKLALEGEALAAASKNPDSPRCGYELEGDDVFCPSCGAKVEERSPQAQNASNPETMARRQKRATRMKYWLTILVLVGINFCINVYCLYLYRNFRYGINGTWHGEHYFWLLLHLLGIGTYVYFVITCVKRLHDMNLSGWLAVPIVVCPIGMCVIYVIASLGSLESVTFKVMNPTIGAVYLGMLLWMGFRRGTKGPNKYGPDPLAGDNEPESLATETAKDSEAKPRLTWMAYVALSIPLLILFFVLNYYIRQQRKQADAAKDSFGLSRESKGSPIGKILNEGSELRSAEQGDAEAQLALGFRYYNGTGVEQDRKEAVKWFRKAAEQGNAEAQSCLGGCYMEGEGVEQDMKEAVKWYRKAADQGLAIAQRTLGLCHVNGTGVTQNKVEAVKWFRKAAEQKLSSLTSSHGKIKLRSPISLALNKEGVVGAQFLLGACYECGEGVEQDKEEAVKWYHKAAEQGHAEAQFNLGVCYNNGEGVEKDSAKAVEWFRKAAANGNEKAEAVLALETLKSNMEKNKAEKFDRARMAAEQGHAEAQFELGEMYEDGSGVKEDGAEAMKWYRRAAEQGHAQAQCKLGRAYYIGKGVQKDEHESAKWYRKAAEQGNADAQFYLGVCYDNGKGVEQNKEEAVKWYRKAAEQGDADAQFNLACSYSNGEGVEQDKKEAVKWYRKAAEQGNDDAKAALKRLGVDSE